MENFIKGYNYIREQYGLTEQQIEKNMRVEDDDCLDVRFSISKDTCIEFTPSDYPEVESDELAYIDWYLETNPTGSWKKFDVDEYGGFENEEYIF